MLQAHRPAARPRWQQLAIYERGVELCRQKRWREGLTDLAWLAEAARRHDVPSLCFSYLGYGLAKFEGKVDDGVRLCQHAIRLEFYQPENYVNLARTGLLLPRYRHEAAEAVRRGLEIDAEHPDLLALAERLGVRRPPVLRFLGRGHLLNQLLGWLRHHLSPPPKRPAVEDSLLDETQTGDGRQPSPVS